MAHKSYYNDSIFKYYHYWYFNTIVPIVIQINPVLLNFLFNPEKKLNVKIQFSASIRNVNQISIEWFLKDTEIWSKDFWKK